MADEKVKYVSRVHLQCLLFVSQNYDRLAEAEVILGSGHRMRFFTASKLMKFFHWLPILRKIGSIECVVHCCQVYDDELLNSYLSTNFKSVRDLCESLLVPI